MRWRNVSGVKLRSIRRRWQIEIRIERHSGLFVNADGRVAFDREQRAELFVRQLGDGFGKIVHRLALLTCQRKDRMPPQLGQTASEFGLKDHNEGNGEEHRKTAEEPADHDQVQQRRDESEGEENNRQPGEHFGTARATKVKIAIVNTDAEQNDFNNAAPAFEPELEKFLHHASSASAARNAATFSLTSWTRIMSAPRPRNVAVSAIVGVRRSLIS